MVEGYYPRLAAVLRDRGYRFDPQRKEMVEYWYCQQTGTGLEVQRCCSRERANALLKQAGIQNQF